MKKWTLTKLLHKRLSSIHQYSMGDIFRVIWLGAAPTVPRRAFICFKFGDVALYHAENRP
jgi:hypothetical protein